MEGATEQTVSQAFFTGNAGGGPLCCDRARNSDEWPTLPVSRWREPSRRSGHSTKKAKNTGPSLQEAATRGPSMGKLECMEATRGRQRMHRRTWPDAHGLGIVGARSALHGRVRRKRFPPLPHKRGRTDHPGLAIVWRNDMTRQDVIATGCDATAMESFAWLQLDSHDRNSKSALPRHRLSHRIWTRKQMLVPTAAMPACQAGTGPAAVHAPSGSALSPFFNFQVRKTRVMFAHARHG